MADLYNLLGVTPAAGDDEVRRAFRREAKRCHPDMVAGASAAEREALQQRFIRLAQAYELLSDPAQRSAYDRRLAAEAAEAKFKAETSSARTTRAQSQSPPKQAPPRQASAPPRDPPPRAKRAASAAQPSRPDLDAIKRDAEESLAAFGLNLRPPGDAAIEDALAWAKRLYRDLRGAVRGGEGSPSSAAEANEAPRDHARPARPTATTRPTPHATSIPNELTVERDLAAIKQGVRQGTARRTATVDDELAALKRAHAKKPAP
jgi:curved DNA-binding protein CbpA